MKDKEKMADTSGKNQPKKYYEIESQITK